MTKDIYRKNNQSVEVMNFGISGYETEQEVEFLKEEGKQFLNELCAKIKQGDINQED